MKTLAFALSVLPLLCIAGSRWTQADLENWLWAEGVSPSDDLNNLPESEFSPEWKKDALKKYRAFITTGGWTTNELVNGFIYSITNHLYSASWPSKRDEVVASMAFGALSYVNQPQVLAFIKQICTNDVKSILGAGIAGVYRYSRFEPEVFDYMRSVCVKTNVYERWARAIAGDMELCFYQRPNYYDSLATNNFARYQYFVLKHVNASQAVVDSQIVDFVPAYSNSIQRLNAMRYVANTATNRDQAVWATNQVNRLSALPTNQLNNVSWLEE